MDNLHRSEEIIEFNETVKKTIEGAYSSATELKRTPITNADYKEKLEKFNQSKTKIETLISKANKNQLYFLEKLVKIDDTPGINDDRYKRNVKKSDEQGENFSQLTECLDELNKVNIENSNMIIEAGISVFKGKIDNLEQDRTKAIGNADQLLKDARELNVTVKQKSTFFNTSGSAEFAKSQDNKTGAHILGFFEAIGRAILTPFIAIALAFRKDEGNYNEKMTTYFDTIKHSITFEK